MPRSNRSRLFGLAGLLTALASSQAAYSGQVEQAPTERSAENKAGTANQPAAPGAMPDREEAGQADCGTPKECRAEQRERDDLIAQQTSAQAAAHQASLAVWQTILLALGTIAVIATLIYTHSATKAALKGVWHLQNSERARLACGLGSAAIIHGVNSAQMRLMFDNFGRTGAIVKEVAHLVMDDNKFISFKNPTVNTHNWIIAAGSSMIVDTIDIPPPSSGKFVGGYCKYLTVFSKELVVDYFCHRLLAEFPYMENAHGQDWPSDGELV